MAKEYKYGYIGESGSVIAPGQLPSGDIKTLSDYYKSIQGQSTPDIGTEEKKYSTLEEL